MNFDLNSADDTMKKIVILPEKFSPESYQLLKTFYGKILTELDNKRANELLVKSTPKAKSLIAQQSLKVWGTQVHATMLKKVQSKGSYTDCLKG